MKPSPVLHMKGISKRFPGVVALDDVSLEVYPAEVVALIGENGAGKSTLMKILGGVIEPDAGAVHVAGREVQIRSPLEASRHGIEFIHQELSVLDNLDVGANIFLRREPTRGGFLKLIDRQRLNQAADALLSKLGPNLSSRTPLSKLSIAQQQLVEIARSISAGARILVMDEPTSSLTLTEARLLLEIIKDLKKRGVSVIYISHRMDEVEEIADRAVVLRDGRYVGTALLQVLKNLVNLLGIPSSLDFAVMSAVILLGVMADQYFTARRNRKAGRTDARVRAGRHAPGGSGRGGSFGRDRRAGLNLPTRRIRQGQAQTTEGFHGGH